MQYLVCSIIVFLTILMITIKKSKARKKRLLRLTVLFFIYAVTIYFVMSTIWHSPEETFDHSKWATVKNDRWKMASSLIGSKRLIGMDSAQVMETIGLPYTKNDSLSLWKYDMGQGGGGLGFRFHYLAIAFKDKRVVKVEKQIVND